MASADIIVEIQNANGTFGSPATFASGAPIQIAEASENRVYRVRAQNPATEDIGQIQFVGSASAPTNVTLLLSETATALDQERPLANAARNWRGVTVVTGNYRVVVQAAIGGNVFDTDQPSNRAVLAASRWVRLDVGGSINARFNSGSVTVPDTTSGVPLTIQAGGIIDGQFEFNFVRAGLIESTGGNISAEIRSRHAPITVIRALNGTISGSINKPMTFPNPVFNFTPQHKIGTISAKNITAEIHASGENNFPGTGSTEPDYFAINEIIATEDIGTSTTAAIIRTSTVAQFSSRVNGLFGGTASIGSIQGRSLHLDVLTPVPSGTITLANARGDVQTLKATGTATGTGFLKGSVTTFSTGFSLATPDNAIEIQGDLLGTITLGGTAKQPIRIEGNVLSTGAVIIAEQDQSINGCIEVAGNVAGRLEIDGDLLALVEVTGDVTGTIAVGRNVQGVTFNSNPYSGRIRILSGSIRPSGRIDIGGGIRREPNDPNPVKIDIPNGKLEGLVTLGGSLDGHISIGQSAGLVG
ncbi:MAG: hypothetical protein K2W85_08135 [Phycisphaerales bacterium]|nr:hypothetical protein [Phycisphaerales bacterium]